MNLSPAAPWKFTTTPVPTIPLRAYIATAALSNLDIKDDCDFGKTDRENGLPEKYAQWAAIAAVRYADALIEELNKETK